MIDDVASLKQAMEQMDAEDVAVSQAAKERAVQILSEANLSFSKLAEMIEERRLLLRPRIVASIKRMDQPDMLGDAAFRDTGFSLRREGQSFHQIAEALELHGRFTPRYDEPMQKGELPHPVEIENEPGVPGWLMGANLVARIVFFPVRHPIRFLTIALLAFLLFDVLLGSGNVSQRVSEYFADVNTGHRRAASPLPDKRIPRPSPEAAAPSTLPTPSSSPSAVEPSPSVPPPSATATASAPPATTPAPSATAPAPSPSAPPASPWTAPENPSASTPRLEPRSVPPSRSAANDRPRAARPRTLEDMIPDGAPRNSRMAGPCIGGIGGCYWGGGRY